MDMSVITPKTEELIIYSLNSVRKLAFRGTVRASASKIFEQVDINAVSKRTCKKMLVVFPSLISKLKTPSSEMVKAIVKGHKHGISYIKNPSEDVQLLAVRKDPFSIQYIINPTEQVQWEACSINQEAYDYIDKPALSVKVAYKSVDKKGF